MKLLFSIILYFLVQFLTYSKKGLELSSLTSPIHFLEMLTTANYNAE